MKKFAGEFDASKDISFSKVLYWKLFLHNPDLAKKRSETYEPPLIYMPERLNILDDFILWLGHASFLIQLDGVRILTDPVFGNIPFYKRHLASPYSIEELGRVDAVLISHTHYDHFDKSSIKKLMRENPELKIYIGMSHDKNYFKWLKPHELKWWEVEELTSQMRIIFVPAKHWGRRGLFDKNRSLWGGFVLEGSKKKIYFSGDTAYGKHFITIGKRFKVDYALLPIGAYKPEFIMKYNHLSPQEAYRAFLDLGAKTLIPMHYGTFDLSDEPLGEPESLMREIAKESLDPTFPSTHNEEGSGTCMAS